jgi:hypothetical protein
MIYGVVPLPWFSFKGFSAVDNRDAPRRDFHQCHRSLVESSTACSPAQQTAAADASIAERVLGRSIDAAEVRRCDLIVMASHERRGVSAVVLTVRRSK